MKKTIIITAVILLSFSSLSAAADETKEKGSYVLGYNIGNNLKRNNIDVDINMFVKGLEDAVSGKKSPYSDKEAKDLIKRLQESVSKAQLKKNVEAEEEFMASNSLKKGVKQTDSGLQYKIIKKGTGKSPTLYDRVKVHYKGTKLNGKVFDSSYKRGKPAVFTLSGVVKGWQEALQIMKVGAKWKLYIPAKLGYGNRGIGPIGPGEMLIFDIELLGIQ